LESNLRNVASAAEKKGIDTLVEFLTANSAKEVVSKRKKADLVLGTFLAMFLI